MTLSRSEFGSRFGDHPIFGMVHLLPLPGSPLWGGSMREVIRHAAEDARAIRDGGAAGMAFENFGDRPFCKGRVGSETVAAMAVVISAVAGEVDRPFGVNVLRNDAVAALAIAAATGASFIRVNVHVGAMLTDQGLIEGNAGRLLRRRRELGNECLIFADHMVKHASPIGTPDEAQSVRDLRERGLADAVIVTGAETGAPADEGRLRLVRASVDAPLLLGSGLTADNAAFYAPLVDGAIVGTSVKRAGLDSPVDRDRVGRLVELFG